MTFKITYNRKTPNSKSIIEIVNYWRYRTVPLIFHPQFFLGHFLPHQISHQHWASAGRSRTLLLNDPSSQSQSDCPPCLHLSCVVDVFLLMLELTNLKPSKTLKEQPPCLSSFSGSHPLLPCLGWSSIHTVLTRLHFVGVIFIGKIRRIHRRKPFYPPPPPPVEVENVPFERSSSCEASALQIFTTSQSSAWCKCLLSVFLFCRDVALATDQEKITIQGEKYFQTI